jgi:hypothetical protein
VSPGREKQKRTVSNNYSGYQVRQRLKKSALILRTDQSATAGDAAGTSSGMPADEGVSTGRQRVRNWPAAHRMH